VKYVDNKVRSFLMHAVHSLAQAATSSTDMIYC